MSNMGYLSTINPVEMRERQGPKNGAISMVNVNVDAVGTVSVTADLTVQGQGHATALSQIVADQLGLEPQDISINLELDTQKDAWSIAAGTYSCRFTPGTAVAAHIAAGRIREKVARIAAKQLNTRPEDIDFGGGRVFSRSNPDNGAPFARVAGTAHWSPVLMPETDEPGLSETGIWSPPQLEPPNSRDEINTSLTYGFVFDICGVEICPVTMEVRVDRYISMHDAGKLINPLLAKGQIHGAFVQGLASALYEEIVYDETGALQSGTFAEYLVPTACEVPPIELLHIETPSPFTPLGAKGLAEGNCMSTPVCIANAVADALSLKDVPLPVTPQRLNALVNGAEPEPPEGIAAPPVPATAHADAAITGEGSVSVAATPAEIWKALLDPESLKHIIPGCHSVSAIAAEHYRAEVSLGVGPIRGRFLADVTLSDLEVERAATLSGGLSGPLGKASGNGRVTLTAQEHGTRIDYTYGRRRRRQGRLRRRAHDQARGADGHRPVLRAPGRCRQRRCGFPRHGWRETPALLVRKAVRRQAMKPAAFTYLRPDSLEEAVEALGEHGADARVLAGGQSLMAMLNLRLVEPRALVDISRLETLRTIRRHADSIEVGAAVTQAELLDWPELDQAAPFIARALPWVGHFQTRNRGTVCGSIAHADPSSELPLSLALLQGEVVLRSRRGERRLKASEFQTGMLQTARADDELITAVRFPAGVGLNGCAFREVARRHGDFAIVSVGAVRTSAGRSGSPSAASPTARPASRSMPA